MVAACSSIWSLIVATMERAKLATPHSNGELAACPSASSSLIRFFYLCYVPFIPCALKIKHRKLFILRIRIDIGVVILSSAYFLFLGVEITSILIVIWI